MPVGTVIRDAASEELIGDLSAHGERVLVAKGGGGGLGNIHFKSSVNRAPRQFTRGRPGEQRELALELRVLADVGLLGLPNAGKSTFLRAVSAARPKVADYPFTTLNPSLGVVRLGHASSFVIADIPGLIEGASEGTGLGIQFLKHLQRTRLLLHLVDLAPLALDVRPVDQVRQLEQEMRKFDTGLMDKPRWLVFSKADLLPGEEARQRAEEAVAELGWEMPWMLISSVTHSGTDELMQKVSAALERMAEEEAEAVVQPPVSADFPEQPFEP